MIIKKQVRILKSDLLFQHCLFFTLISTGRKNCSKIVSEKLRTIVETYYLLHFLE